MTTDARDPLRAVNAAVGKHHGAVLHANDSSSICFADDPREERRVAAILWQDQPETIATPHHTDQSSQACPRIEPNVRELPIARPPAAELFDAHISGIGAD